MTRHGLLLTAVATVTVPGLLAVMAVVGHEHVPAKTDGAAVALDGGARSSAAPAAAAPMSPAAAAHAAVQGSAAALPSTSAAPAPAVIRATPSQRQLGTSLLDKSADAVQVTSYQGTELFSQTGVAGPIKLVSEVWHQGGGATLVHAPGGLTTPAERVATPSDAPTASQSGVFGVTKPLVALLGRHYVAVYQGDSSAIGRKSAVVDLYRFNGSLAARYWLDKQTMVPLRRELFDTANHPVSDDSFVQVKFGGTVRDGVSSVAAQAQQAANPAWIAAVPPSRFLASLASQGWQVPSTTQPGGLPLYAAASAKTPSGEVAQLEYSDGLYVVSLFVQRGTLAPNLAGWQPVKVANQQAFASGHTVTWSGLGFVYTVIADAPPQTVTQMVAAVPTDAPAPGLMDRLGHGFSRLASLIDPFG